MSQKVLNILSTSEYAQWSPHSTRQIPVQPLCAAALLTKASKWMQTKRPPLVGNENVIHVHYGTEE